MKTLLTLFLSCLLSFGSYSQYSQNIQSANTFFDDGRGAKFSAKDGVIEETVVGLFDDNTGQYVTYSKASKKDDGTEISDADIIKGRGIYRKKGSQFYVMNFDGPVNIRWFGAVGDGKTDNYECFLQALKVSSFIRIPKGNFAISKSISINKTVQLLGDGMNVSTLTCLEKNSSALVLGDNSAVKTLSLVNLSNLTLKNGKFGISAVRENGPQLIIERMRVFNVNFEGQSDAGIYIRGKKILFLVNNILESVFRYCGTGIYIYNIFSGNLNHIILNRFEGTTGGISIATVNNELSQVTIDKNRFEAIMPGKIVKSPIEIFGGNQNVSLRDNYFEDVPDPVISINALSGMSISPSIINNQFSANIKGKIMIKLASQVNSPYIGSNVFKPGQSGVLLEFGPFVSGPVIQANYGNVAISSTYPIPYSAFKKKNVDSESKDILKVQNIQHAGNFSFELKLPSQGLFNISVAVADDGDFSLGGVVSYNLSWFKAGAPLNMAEIESSKLNPNTPAIHLSEPTNDGIVNVIVKKSDLTKRVATCYYNLKCKLDVDLANVLEN